MGGLRTSKRSSSRRAHSAQRGSAGGAPLDITSAMMAHHRAADSERFVPPPIGGFADDAPTAATMAAVALASAEDRAWELLVNIASAHQRAQDDEALGGKEELRRLAKEARDLLSSAPLTEAEAAASNRAARKQKKMRNAEQKTASFTAQQGATIQNEVSQALTHQISTDASLCHPDQITERVEACRFDLDNDDDDDGVAAWEVVPHARAGEAKPGVSRPAPPSTTKKVDTAITKPISSSKSAHEDRSELESGEEEEEDDSGCVLS